VVVVEAVTKAEESAGDESEFERGGHWPSGRVRRDEGRCKLRA
jgi:hypothetical protein